MGKRSTNLSSLTNGTTEPARGKQLTVTAELEAVLDQDVDRVSYLLPVSKHRYARLIFWTRQFCVKDRYARFENHLNQRRLMNTLTELLVSAACPDPIRVPVPVSGLSRFINSRSRYEYALLEFNPCQAIHLARPEARPVRRAPKCPFRCLWRPKLLCRPCALCKKDIPL